MKFRVTGFFRIPCCLATLLIAGSAYAETVASPRAASNVINVSSPRAESNRVVRASGTNQNNTAATVSGRSSSDTVARGTTRRTVTNTSTVSRSAMPVHARTGAATARSGTIRKNSSAGAGVSRAATSRAASSNVVRSATHNLASMARAASNQSVVGASRSSMARATAVFSDVSKIGGGYATCRDAYATCMDQFCANANDTYRRCICSSKYTDIRNTESAIDQALSMLTQFENNDLTAVTLSAEEVSAMYSATEGEMAIKNDTSAAAQMLTEISDLLAGRTTASSNTTSTNNSTTSLGILTVDFTSDLDDIWSNTGNSIFNTTTDTGVDLSTLEGQALYNQVNTQCLELVADSCENDAVLTMARSAYSIMITQDCNTYQKRVDAQKESLENTVRTAEKYLREARLEEYRAHNSADVNECITAVRSAILSDVACGPNFEKCMDYTGAYINSTTGDAIYSPRLFELADVVVLPGVNSSGAGDILGENPEFNAFLDEKRMYAESALDTCRDMADIVWQEFKRQAIIEIAQAQDEKIEEVKMSCVSTMAECYDTQTGALQDFDNTTSQYTGAISAYAAREMCADQVIACASLYGNTSGCEFDGNGRLTAGNNDGSTFMGAAASERCGLTALLKFVDTVDTVRVSEGCETALENYLTDICTPESGSRGYPWNCINLLRGQNGDRGNDTLWGVATNFAQQNCSLGSNTTGLPTAIQTTIENVIDDISEEIEFQLAQVCEADLGGLWLAPGTVTYKETDVKNLTTFYSTVYGGNTGTAQDDAAWGRCVENTTKVQCLAYNVAGEDPVATYDQTRDECVFSEDWYQGQCENVLGGYYEFSECYVPESVQ